MERELLRYRHMWTTQKDDYVLFTVKSGQMDEYLILHRPSRRVFVARSQEDEYKIVNKMLAHDAIVLDDPPA